MLTFLEFYQTLLQFVNFKLYHSLSVHYPPVLDSKLEEAAAGLAAIMQDIAQHQPHKTANPLAITNTINNTPAGLVTADIQTLPTAVLDASQAAASATSGPAAAATTSGASDEEADEDAGEIDSGDEVEDDDDASASDEDVAAEARIAEGEQIMTSAITDCCNTQGAMSQYC